MRGAGPHDTGDDSFTVEALGPNLFVTTLRGKITYAMAESAYQTFSPMIESMHQPVWLSDATQVTSFDPKTLALGARWFMAFKRRGGTYCLVASRWERAIMAARTMALGLGVRVQAFSSLSEARRAAQKLIDEGGGR